jgi:ABC-type multidrug transport system ATPase subunit
MTEAMQKLPRACAESRLAISVEGLTYVYPGQERPAVDDVSFHVEEGEIFGLLGPSGAGKTTTQRVLTRQQRRFTGDVRVLGRPLAEWGPEYFEEIGVGFELPNHYLKFTAVENLRFFASLYTRKSRDPLELLAMVGLEGAAHKRVDEFSKGMRMRLNFVRAFQHEPSLLFLDEPTAGLDPAARRGTWQHIEELKADGVTVVLTTHLLDEAEHLADRVAIVDHGRLVASGTPDELTHGEHGALEFSARPGLAVAELATAIGAAVEEVRLGRYLVHAPNDPGLVARLAAWLDEQDVRLGELRAGKRTLEDVFLRLTSDEAASAREPVPPGGRA